VAAKQKESPRPARVPLAPTAEELSAFRAAADALGAFRAQHSKGLVKKRLSPKAAEEFQQIFRGAAPAIDSRFGKTMDKNRKVRTQPDEERLMAEGSRALFDLFEAGLGASLGREAAALGVLTFYVGDYRDALHWVNEAAKLNPDDLPNTLNGAVLAVEFFEFELALRLLGEVLLESPDLKLAWSAKARALTQLKLAEEQEAADLEKRGKRDEAQALRKRAKTRPEEALSALREVVRIDPADAGAWYEFGKFLFKHGKLRESADAYGKAVALDPSMKLAWYQKGTAHQMLEQPDEAIAAFDKGLALDQRDPGGFHFRLAAMHALKGDREKAFEFIRSGLSINKPNFYSEIYKIEFGGLWSDPRWETLVAEFFADTGFQHTKAMQAELGFSWGLFDYGSALFYDSLTDAFAAAEAYRREGQTDKAREFYEKLLALLERDGHPLKARIVRGRLASLSHE